MKKNRRAWPGEEDWRPVFAIRPEAEIGDPGCHGQSILPAICDPGCHGQSSPVEICDPGCHGQLFPVGICDLGCHGQLLLAEIWTQDVMDNCSRSGSATLNATVPLDYWTC